MKSQFLSVLAAAATAAALAACQPGEPPEACPAGSPHGFPYAGRLQLDPVPLGDWKPQMPRLCAMVPDQFRPATYRSLGLHATLEARHLPHIPGEPEQTPAQAARAYREHLMAMSAVPEEEVAPPCTDIVTSLEAHTFICSAHDDDGTPVESSIFSFLAVPRVPNMVLVETDVQTRDHAVFRAAMTAHSEALLFVSVER